MKIALYIDDAVEQIILTPESETERGILGKLHDDSRDFAIHRGGFYACRGGWTRHGIDQESTMIVLRPKAV